MKKSFSRDLAIEVIAVSEKVILTLRYRHDGRMKMKINIIKK